MIQPSSLLNPRSSSSHLFVALSAEATEKENTAPVSEDDDEEPPAAASRDPTPLPLPKQTGQLFESVESCGGSGKDGDEDEGKDDSAEEAEEEDEDELEYDSDGDVNFYSAFPPVVKQPKPAPPVLDDVGVPYPPFDECYKLQTQQGAHAGHGGDNDQVAEDGMVCFDIYFCELESPSLKWSMP